MADEENHRKKPCYWDVPGSMQTIRLSPEGPGMEVFEDEKGRCYVIEEDGERTYLVFG